MIRRLKALDVRESIIIVHPSENNRISNSNWFKYKPCYIQDRKTKGRTNFRVD